jgi:hypothetical protein
VKWPLRIPVEFPTVKSFISDVKFADLAQLPIRDEDGYSMVTGQQLGVYFRGNFLRGEKETAKLLALLNAISLLYLN